MMQLALWIVTLLVAGFVGWMFGWTDGFKAGVNHEFHRIFAVMKGVPNDKG